MIFPRDFIEKVGIEPYYSDEHGVIYCRDCLEVMREIPDGVVDAIITDPPYGIALETDYTTKYKGARTFNAIVGDETPFDPRPLLRFYDKPMIIWGGNCFASMLPDHPGWLAWIKATRNNVKIRQAEAEFAWTNFITRPQCFRTCYIGAYKDVGYDIPIVHPTQKPIELMRWCTSLIPDSQIILDPYAGSGSTLVAAKQLGRRYVGIDIVEKYCAIAVDRLAQRELELR